MPFLMSHEGVFHRGSKIAKSKKSVPHHLCGSVTIPLKEIWFLSTKGLSQDGCMAPVVKVQRVPKEPMAPALASTLNVYVLWDCRFFFVVRLLP